jgi:hypothetical protein
MLLNLESVLEVFHGLKPRYLYPLPYMMKNNSEALRWSSLQFTKE